MEQIGRQQPTPGFDDALGSFVDDARRARAQRQRQNLNDASTMAGLSGTFLGSLVEIAEAARPVLLLTRSGAFHRGEIALVGADVVALTGETGSSRVLLGTNAIEGIREETPGRVRSQAVAPSRPTMASLLDDFAVDRSRVALVTAGGNRMMGTLVQVGEDQVTIKLDGDADSLTLPVDAIDEVVIEP